MKSLFIALTIVMIVFLYSFLNYNKTNNIQKHLEKETTQYSILYKTLYKEFKSKSQLIFDLMIDKKKITNIYKEVNFISQSSGPNICDQRFFDLRERLYTELKNQYSKIKTNSKIPVIHFHTKNNLSFLSMEELKNFCYDLTPVRPLLVAANSVRKPIDGFEIGKTSSMFRFLFPIIDKDLHLGSVEISYDSLIFINEFTDHSNALAQIHISKKIVDQKFSSNDQLEQYYKKSPLKGMYTINKLISNIEKQTQKKYQQIITSKPTREQIEQMMASTKKAFSVYDDLNGYSITIIPIINPASKVTVGYFTTKHFSKYIKKEIDLFYKFFFVMGFFIIITMILTYKYFSGKIKRSQLLKEKNQELAKKQNELEIINTNLEEIVTKKINENLKQKEFITKQSKIAALGEMMDAIAHQWKQPLNVIGMTMNNIMLKIDFDENVTKKDILELGQNTRLQIDHLITTIDEFRKFFRPDQPTSTYKIKEVIDSTLELDKNFLIKNKVDMQTNIDENLEFECIKTEFIHVILNIINNSIDAFNEKNIEGRIINITAYQTDTNVAIEICDNAGGIQKETLPYIFKSNYTTKKTGKGTGIGLYLAKQIIEKIGGSIEAFNKENGVCFKILVSKVKEE